LAKYYFYVEYNVKDTELILAENSEEALKLFFDSIREDHESDPTRIRYNPPNSVSIRRLASEGSVLKAIE
jgi:hypothetical protein